MKFILALDQGTTSSRAMVFDATGAAIATAQREFRQIFPQPGWVEHDAEEIWSSQFAAAREALRLARLKPSDLAAIGITNQRETTLVWDRRTGRPITNAIVWQDRRTAPAEVLTSGFGSKLRAAPDVVGRRRFAGGASANLPASRQSSTPAPHHETAARSCPALVRRDDRFGRWPGGQSC